MVHIGLHIILYHGLLRFLVYIHAHICILLIEKYTVKLKTATQSEFTNKYTRRK